MESTVLLAALAIVSAAMAAQVWLIKTWVTSILPLLNSLLVAIKSSDTYLRERNGRDNTFQASIAETLITIRDETIQNNKDVAKQLKVVGDGTAHRLEEITKMVIKQNVKEQHVEHQTIEGK